VLAIPIGESVSVECSTRTIRFDAETRKREAFLRAVGAAVAIRVP
jgi:hypothetical protein